MCVCVFPGLGQGLDVCVCVCFQGWGRGVIPCIKSCQPGVKLRLVVLPQLDPAIITQLCTPTPSVCVPVCLSVCPFCLIQYDHNDNCPVCVY